MNRQIEFRGKCIHDDKWYCGYLYIHEPPLKCLCDETKEDSKYYIIKTGDADWNMDRPKVWYEIDKETIGQFTNKIDKNNKKIFEGDYVKVPSGFGGDYYYDEALGIVIFESCEFRIESKNWSDFSWDELEIVGNVFDGVKNVDN